MTKEYEVHLFLFQVLTASSPTAFSVIESIGSLQLYILFPTHYLCETGGDSRSLYMQMSPNAQVSLIEAPATLNLESQVSPTIVNTSHSKQNLKKTGNVFEDLNLLS